MKISIVGTEHMAQSFSYCLEKMGHEVVPLWKCNVCWIAIDTPISKEGQGDIKPVFNAIKKVKPQLKDGTLVICSSQIPVGTSQELIKMLGDKINYAYIPEHMRMGRGIFDFMSLSQITIGVDDDKCKGVLREMFRPKSVFFTNIASAEMIKHTTNAFLATTVSFINDIADICERVGADVGQLGRGEESGKGHSQQC